MHRVVVTDHEVCKKSAYSKSTGRLVDVYGSLRVNFGVGGSSTVETERRKNRKIIAFLSMPNRFWRTRTERVSRSTLTNWISKIAVAVWEAFCCVPGERQNVNSSKLSWIFGVSFRIYPCHGCFPTFRIHFKFHFQGVRVGFVNILIHCIQYSPWNGSETSRKHSRYGDMSENEHNWNEIFLNVNIK